MDLGGIRGSARPFLVETNSAAAAVMNAIACHTQCADVYAARSAASSAAPSDNNAMTKKVTR